MESFAMCEYLISKGADVNAQNSELKTPLHCAIEDDGFEIAKLLLKNGADPFLKSIHGDDALQTACICAVVGVFEYLIENYLYSKERTAEAHELIGSSLIEKRGNLGEALNHWKTALSIRNEDSNNYLEKKTIDRKAPFLDVTEFSSVEELEKISEDLDAIMMQTLLVRQRILGTFHVEMNAFLVIRMRTYAKYGEYKRCMDLFLYFLEFCIDEPLITHACHTVQMFVVYLFLFNERYNGNRTFPEQMQFSDIYELIRSFVSVIAVTKELLKIRPIFEDHEYYFDEMLKAFSYLLRLLYDVPKTSEERAEMKEIVYRVSRIAPRTSSGDTILHLVVSKERTIMNVSSRLDLDLDIFPHAGVAELLLQCGANVEAVNCSLNTPLHVAAEVSNYDSVVLCTLLRYGAHADRKNEAGTHPLDMLKEIAECTVSPFQYITLKCLAARKIMENHVPFSGEVPEELEGFIKFH